ncbi:MAG: 3-oxoacyl-[acyl-carrier-protein] reductase [Candidatus Latescibacteria bacterium]|nr:3-oxoacyl-[acyl-carrier-protein] reductase [bacterium]MBD3424090.1 3-oxoacyl-[acyl-carrier-protein] reductase [Candidatus Latescibacterota bacterium]
MLEVEGKTAVITGAGRGIGRDIALVLAEAGVSSAVVDIDPGGVEETAGMVKESGAGAKALRCDITDPDEVKRCAGEILEWKDQVHFLVNNAGITRDNLLLRMKDREWEDVLKVNLTGAFNFTRAIARHMLKKRFGRIVNIASVIGLIGNAGQANYAASKAGLIGFTRSVARELAPRGITANAIAPGFIQTAMTDKLSEDVTASMMGSIPLGRFGTGRDVASIVLFLLSELGSYVTGQVINCDGGMVMD